ncbi:MAG: mechanosensitive ion channel family protein [Candidatus Woesearchaeota archaeon]
MNLLLKYGKIILSNKLLQIIDYIICKEANFIKEAFIVNLESNIFSFILVVMILVSLRWLILRAINKRIAKVSSVYKWRKTLNYLFFFLTFILILSIWVEDTETLFAYMGLFSAGLAIAFKDLLINLLGWFFILWKRPLKIGDRIEVDGVAGDVVDIRAFQFSMIEIGNWVKADQSTGRLVHIPNGKVLSSEVFNYSSEFNLIWDEVSVLITFESDWKKTKELLLKIAKKYSVPIGEAERKIKHASRKFMIYYKNLTPIVYLSVEASGISLTMRYLSKVQERRGVKGQIWEEILDIFEGNDDMELAYPTQRLILNK